MAVIFNTPLNSSGDLIRYPYTVDEIFSDTIDAVFDRQHRRIRLNCSDITADKRSSVVSYILTDMIPLWTRSGVCSVVLQQVPKYLMDKQSFNKEVLTESVQDELVDVCLQIADGRVITGKAVKVVSAYAGDFRQIPSIDKNPLALWKQVWEIERSIIYGYPTDLLIVYNYPLADESVKDATSLREFEKFLFGLDGLQTKQGLVRVVQRPNIGISFGGFDFAFRSFRHAYDFWFFSEDDYLTVKDGIVSEAVCKLHSPWHSALVGFVAVGGVSHAVAPHVCGGCGVTSREILEKVCATNIMSEYRVGCLPHYPSTVPGTAHHNVRAEVPFVNCICRLGYHLWDVAIESPVMLWLAADSGVFQWTSKLSTFDEVKLDAFRKSRVGEGRHVVVIGSLEPNTGAEQFKDTLQDIGEECLFQGSVVRLPSDVELSVLIAALQKEGSIDALCFTEGENALRTVSQLFWGFGYVKPGGFCVVNIAGKGVRFLELMSVLCALEEGFATAASLLNDQQLLYVKENSETFRILGKIDEGSVKGSVYIRRRTGQCL